jgi:hypothetical protein
VVILVTEIKKARIGEAGQGLSPSPQAVTTPPKAVTAVTGGRKPLKIQLSPAELRRCEFMHVALVLALKIAEHSNGQIGPARLRAVWPDTKTDFWAYGSTPQGRVRLPPTAAQIALRDVVLEGLLTVFANDAFEAKLIMGRALGVKWPRLQSYDPKGRTDRMLRHVQQNALLKLWGAVGPRAQNLLQGFQKF